MPNTAIILSAGMGKRMQAGKNKQFIELNGKSVLTHTLSVFALMPDITNIVLVVRAGEEELCREMVPTMAKNKTILVAGGKERQDSVYNGIKAINWECDYIIVHDGARPLVTLDIISRTLEAAKTYGAAVCGVPVKDTIKQVNPDGSVIQTIPRNSLYAVQTPQIFQTSKLKKAYDYAYEHNFYGTDDASLLEYMGEKVQIVLGDYENIKLTTPEDIQSAEAILQKRKQGDAKLCE